MLAGMFGSRNHLRVGPMTAVCSVGLNTYYLRTDETLSACAENEHYQYDRCKTTCMQIDTNLVSMDAEIVLYLVAVGEGPVLVKIINWINLINRGGNQLTMDLKNCSLEVCQKIRQYRITKLNNTWVKYKGNTKTHFQIRYQRKILLQELWPSWASKSKTGYLA